MTVPKNQQGLVKVPKTAIQGQNLTKEHPYIHIEEHGMTPKGNGAQKPAVQHLQEFSSMTKMHEDEENDIAEMKKAKIWKNGFNQGHVRPAPASMIDLRSQHVQGPPLNKQQGLAFPMRFPPQ
eukprot:TRINITY_DN4281_c0_g1_i1.p1 TRINITY_DN4281_c0_g1~~TRINITY_DN4281_c0_g1_i1.p1  ORF type:complete len:123 (-),score=23.67 TRINITY_DN4281_c0_g1_i1:145-513(-)